ncbi:hypothetical protein PGTUg99_016558 [Puccinia graminis f. sp. tritici]|uniref:Uncharacterized protein n=1 Tax=Puccinia graminis f. sp. tritici TaxID=56615 RepID=A0A5B0M8R4_PUCGR|nr:hypothetical protein PGTUg99_016558 [Puccinia graminis f. sp. tritici]
MHPAPTIAEQYIAQSNHKLSAAGTDHSIVFILSRYSKKTTTVISADELLCGEIDRFQWMNGKQRLVPMLPMELLGLAEDRPGMIKDGTNPMKI